MQRLPLPESIPKGVEVWLLKLNLQMPVPASDLSLLSDDERIRSLRFRKHQDRVRSIVTRAALRRMLGARLMLPPGELRFVANGHGKPRLYGDLGIEFNVSHAGHLALIAFSTSGKIGVDIEHRDRGIDAKSLSKYVFSPLERQSRLQTGEETEDFMERWVAKESVLKALGLGISDHLQAVSVLPFDEESYEIAHDHPEWREIKAWPLPAPDGYAAAVALQSPSPRLAPRKNISRTSGVGS
ncbi:MAG: 4'-phosphopantetheinyl transferase family protein [Nitrosospira sp.]